MKYLVSFYLGVLCFIGLVQDVSGSFGVSPIILKPSTSHTCCLACLAGGRIVLHTSNECTCVSTKDGLSKVALMKFFFPSSIHSAPEKERGERGMTEIEVSFETSVLQRPNTKCYRTSEEFNGH